MLAAGVAYFGGVYALSLSGVADITRIEFGADPDSRRATAAGVFLLAVAAVGFAT